MMQACRALVLLALLSVASPLAAVEPERCPKPLDTCLVELRAAYPNHGVLGFQFSGPGRDEPVPPGSFVLRAVPPGYPAHAAGLQPGDVLLSLKGKPLTGLPREEVERLMDTIQVGEVVPLEVLRQGKKRSLEIKAGKPDAMSVEAWVGQHVRRAHSEEDFRRYLRELRTGSSQKPNHLGN